MRFYTRTSRHSSVRFGFFSLITFGWIYFLIKFWIFAAKITWVIVKYAAIGVCYAYKYLLTGLFYGYKYAVIGVVWLCKECAREGDALRTWLDARKAAKNA